MDIKVLLYLINFQLPMQSVSITTLTSGMSPRTGTDKVGSGVTGFRTKGKQNKGQQMKKKH
jgi:hypothetical protein